MDIKLVITVSSMIEAILHTAFSQIPFIREEFFIFSGLIMSTFYPYFSNISPCNMTALRETCSETCWAFFKQY